MRLKRFNVVRWLTVGVLVVVAAATALAQRGGYQPYLSYSGNVRYDGKFVFVRMSYPYFSRNAAPWSHDYPWGENNFLKILTFISNVNAHVNESSIMAFGDPEMYKFPVIYLCEPGYWTMTDDEVVALRTYLQKGGVLIVDDFPYGHWGYFDVQMARVFPEGRFIDLTAEHPIFHSFFEIDSFDIIPQHYMAGRPIFRAMFEGNDEKKRMMVMVNYNTDISEYWESYETGIRPVSETNQAFKLGVNEFIYAITH
jgi:hypothetical protein